MEFLKRHCSSESFPVCFFLILIVGISLGLCACVGEKPSNITGAKLAVDLVVFPGVGTKRFYLDIKSVELERADADGDVVTALEIMPVAAIDLLGLKGGGSLPLGDARGLEPGFYDALVLRLADKEAAVLVGSDGTERAVPILDLNKTYRLEGPFEIKEGETTELVVALHLASSLITPDVSPEAGESEYVMKPLFSVVNSAAASEIAGQVPQVPQVHGSGALLACAFPAGTPLNVESAPCANAAGASNVVEGHYEMAYLPEGRYDVGILGEDGSFQFAGKGVELTPGQRRSLPPPVPPKASKVSSPKDISQIP